MPITYSDTARTESHHIGHHDSKCTEHLNILVWNIRGITDKTNDPNVQNFLFKNDIILLLETHTDSSAEKRYNNIPGYIFKNFYRKTRIFEICIR